MDFGARLGGGNDEGLGGSNGGTRPRGQTDFPDVGGLRPRGQMNSAEVSRLWGSDVRRLGVYDVDTAQIVATCTAAATAAALKVSSMRVSHGRGFTPVIDSCYFSLIVDPVIITFMICPLTH